MDTETARLYSGLSQRARARRHREDLERIAAKRLALIDSMAGDESEREALALLSYGQLVCRLHGTPPTLPLTVEQAQFIEHGRAAGSA
jgi:hypothetical protein